MQEEDAQEIVSDDEFVGEQVSITDLREKFRAVAVTVVPEEEQREAEKAQVRADREAKKEKAKVARDAKKKQAEADEHQAHTERDARAAHDAQLARARAELEALMTQG